LKAQSEQTKKETRHANPFQLWPSYLCCDTGHQQENI